jgi:hypothetical protein
VRIAAMAASARGPKIFHKPRHSMAAGRGSRMGDGDDALGETLVQAGSERIGRGMVRIVAMSVL